MAIAKVRARKVEWTRSSLIQVSIAAALVLVSIFLGYVAVRKFGLKRSFGSALRYCDSNRPGNALPELTAALEWNPNHHVARELLAKLKTESGAFEEAEGHYQQLIEAEGARKETALCGLGVIALKRADREKNEKGAAEQIKRARDFFKQAKGANPAIPEAEIGLLHCELLELRRSGREDAGAIRRLAERFAKVLETLSSNVEVARTITREGLVDLYAGRGWTQAGPGGSAEVASKYFKACYQYAPRWVLPLLNKRYIDARRFAEGNFTLSDLRAQEKQIRLERNELKNLWKGQPNVYGRLEEPWLQYCLATSYAFARVEDYPYGTYRNLAHEVLTEEKYKARLGPQLLDVWVAWHGAMRDNTDPGTKNMAIEQFYQALDKFRSCEVLQKEEHKALRAAVLHDLGWAQEHRAAFNNHDADYEVAVTLWKEALKLQECYETYRNIAVVQKRRGKPDAAEWFEKAMRSADGLSGDLKPDVDQLKKFMAEGKS